MIIIENLSNAAKKKHTKFRKFSVNLICHLEIVLLQIGQTNPALLQLISENQESFLNMLNEPNADELNVDVANSGSGGGGGGGGGLVAPTAGAGERPSDAATLVLTAQDRDAIERVKFSAPSSHTFHQEY